MADCKDEQKDKTILDSAIVIVYSAAVDIRERPIEISKDRAIILNHTAIVEGAIVANVPSILDRPIIVQCRPFLVLQCSIVPVSNECKVSLQIG